MYIRYRQVQFSIESEKIDLDSKWNKWGEITGGISCLGMSVVANFQETAVVIMHFLGAVMAFAIGTAFFLIQVSNTT